jgi:hypothetical protein
MQLIKFDYKNRYSLFLISAQLKSGPIRMICQYCRVDMHTRTVLKRHDQAKIASILICLLT